MLKIVPVLILLFLLGSCASKKKVFVASKKKFELRIVLEETKDDQLIDWYGLLRNDDKQIHESYFSKDTTTNQYVRIWRKLAEGEYTYTVRSITGKEKRIIVRNDRKQKIVTSLDMGYRKVDSLTVDEVLNAQSLELVYTVNGCFSAEVQRFCLSRSPFTNQYTIAFSSNDEGHDVAVPVLPRASTPSMALAMLRTVSDSKMKQLELQLERERRAEEVYRKSNGTIVASTFVWSTIRVNLYLVADGKYMEYADQSGDSPDGFKSFKGNALPVRVGSGLWR